MAFALKRILLVEDNPNDAELTLEALAEHNLANGVELVKDGEAALDYLYRRGAFVDRGKESPVVVLLDLKLPKVSGLEVLRRIREDPRTRHMPTVILTSSDEERDRLQGYERGANSFVRKPMMFADFIEAVGQLGLYWTVLNRLPPDGPS